uniref:AB hydrolase-1 domain-containing protein n=2 Tax=gambiae species complex TaxID=44542 RepID=A0A1S4GZA1_ANOGA
MSPAFLAVIAVILCILFRILNVSSTPQIPSIVCKDGQFMECFNKIAPMLREPYIPTRLWGFSGHIQTIIHSIVGRVKCPWPLGERVYLALTDGSTLTYDLYQPLITTVEDDITVAICPGIGNSSESVYIRTFVHYAQCHGYRCAVLNHIGVLDSVQVTSSRIFTYGHTDDYSAMINSLLKKYPTTNIVSVGFSLGGNLISKYLGEAKRPANIIGGVSICQGYNAVVATQWLLKWQNFHRFYLYVLTENVKSIIMKHRHVLLSDDIKQRYQLNERDIAAAATLPELDEAYTRRVHQFPTVKDMYSWSSSLNYLANIQRPMVFLANGGHLGFYEGGLVYPNPVTWLDRAVVSLIGGIVMSHNDLLVAKRTASSSMVI